MAIELKILCAGAVQGLVKVVQQEFAAETGASVAGRFGAVGAMREALMAGEPCDLMIVTDLMIDALVRSGELEGDSHRLVGRVHTGIAVRAGEPRPDISSTDALRAALRSAEGLYFPDPERSTAGIHFAGVLRRLGLYEGLQPRFRAFPNGAAAMRELAASRGRYLIGCTQITEINYTEGVALVGALSGEFELSTDYAAAVGGRAAQPELGRRFIDLLAGERHAQLRQAGGFEPAINRP